MNGRYRRAVLSLSPPVFLTRRLRGCLDLVFVLLIWGVLVALATAAYRLYIERAYVGEVLFIAATVKQELMAARAGSGTWPLTIDDDLVPASEREGRTVRLELAEGAFTFVIGRDETLHRVSFRAAVSESSARAPIQWLCGYASPPPGYRVVAENRTDIPTWYLPSICRGSA